MGLVRSRRVRAAIGRGFWGPVLTWLAACVDYAEQAPPCEPPLAAEAGDGEPEAPVLAATLPAGGIVVERRCAADGTCFLQSRTLRRPDGTPVPSGAPLVLAGDGSAAVALVEGRLLRWDLADDEPLPAVRDDTPLDPPVAALVAPLRTGRVVLVRLADQQLAAYDPYDRSVRPLAGADLRVVAVGDRHVLLARLRAGSRRDLYVLDVLSPHLGPQALLAGAFDPQALAFAPADRYLAVTAGRAPVETWVFRLDEGSAPEPVDRFVGRVVTGRTLETGTLGIRAFSPAGDRLAYAGPEGGLLLRDPERATTCSAWPADAGAVSVAGFAAGGWLHLEREGPDGSDLAALEVATGTPWSLAEGRGLHLYAAPGASDSGTPWALGVEDGAFYVVTPRTSPRYLPFARLTPLPGPSAPFGVVARDDPSPTAGPGDRLLSLHRVGPGDAIPPEAGPAWPAPPPAEVGPAEDPQAQRPFVVHLDAADRVCIAGRLPDVAARRCGTAGSPGFLLGAAPADPLPDPVLPPE